MKKIIIASIITTLCMSSLSFASQQFQVNAKSRFFPISWTSENNKDVVSIQFGSNEGSKYYNVFIQVDKEAHDTPGKKGADIVIKNCTRFGNKTVTAGSSIICTLNENNPIIKFSSKSDTDA